MPDFYTVSMEAAADNKKMGVICFYGAIGDIAIWNDEQSPTKVKRDIAALGPIDGLIQRINSPGGNPIAANAIRNYVHSLGIPVTTHVDGMAASAATLLLDPRDEVIMEPGSFLFVHEVSARNVSGRADELRTTADEVEKMNETFAALYAQFTGKPKDEMRAMMAKTALMTASEALEMGFAKRIGSAQLTASLDGEKVIVNGVAFDPAEYGATLPASFTASLPALDAATEVSEVETDAAADVTADQAVDVDNETTEAAQRVAEAQASLDTEIENTLDSERQRIALIDQISACIPGSEELAKQAKFDKPISAVAFALQLFTAGHVARALALNAHLADAALTTHVQPAGNPDADAFRAQVEATAKRIESHLTVKVGH